MGQRLSRSSVLSDPKVIDLLNREFIAAELNVTDQGFPEALPGLAYWKKIYREVPTTQAGFGNQVVLDASGRYPLGSGDDGQLDRWATSVNYNPTLYAQMLNLALDRWHRLEAIRARADLPDAERKAQIQALQAEVGRSVARAYRRAAW